MKSTRCTQDLVPDTLIANGNLPCNERKILICTEKKKTAVTNISPFVFALKPRAYDFHFISFR